MSTPVQLVMYPMTPVNNGTLIRSISSLCSIGSRVLLGSDAPSSAAGGGGVQPERTRPDAAGVRVSGA